MTKIVRYSLKETIMVEDEEGEWVKFEDYHTTLTHVQTSLRNTFTQPGIVDPKAVGYKRNSSRA